MISNIALYNELVSLTAQVKRLRQSICCSAGGDIVYVGSTGTLNLSGTGTEEDPIIGDVIGGGITSVSTTDSDSIAFTGDGTPGNHLSATIITTSIPTIYTSDGLLTANRTVSLDGHNLTFSGGTGTNISLGAAGQQLKVGSTGFNVNNGGITNSNFSITGGGTFTVTDQGSIQLTKVTSGGSTSTILMNPSNVQGLFLQDNNGNINSQIRLDASNTGNCYIRQSNATIESNINIIPGAINFNKVVSTTTTTLLKVDSTNSKVVLPLITSAPFLTTDGSGNITAGTKAAHVDPTTGTLADVINALIAAGLMA